LILLHTAQQAATIEVMELCFFKKDWLSKIALCMAVRPWESKFLEGLQIKTDLSLII
jgi:hypothetical protein